MKIQQLPIERVTFCYHPLLMPLVAGSAHIALGTVPYHELSKDHVAILLQHTIVPVTPGKRDMHYYLLEPHPYLFLLQAHPKAATLNVPAIVYDDTDIQKVLQCLALDKLALLQRLGPSLTRQLRERLHA